MIMEVHPRKYNQWWVLILIKVANLLIINKTTTDRKLRVVWEVSKIINLQALVKQGDLKHH